MENPAMTKIHSILVATDFSAGGDAAVRRAVQLAVAHGASLSLLHAFDAQQLTSDPASKLRLRQRLTDGAASILAQSGIAVDVQFGAGPPELAIAACARAQAVSLVVVGARADPDLAGLGSTASKVARSPAHPVLIVRAGSSKPCARVLTAVDLREGSVHALAFALALFPAAHHRLVYALAPTLDGMTPAGALGQAPQQQVLESMHARAERGLQQLVLRVAGQARHPVVFEVADDLPERAILVDASAWPADCVVVGYRGERSPGDSIPGNMAQHVIQYTLVDVLVVP